MGASDSFYASSQHRPCTICILPGTAPQHPLVTNAFHEKLLRQTPQARLVLQHASCELDNLSGKQVTPIHAVACACATVRVLLKCTTTNRVTCHAMLCCAALRCTVLHCTVLRSAVMCCAVPCHAVLCCALLCCAVLCRAVLCCEVLRRSMLCHYSTKLVHELNCCQHAESGKMKSYWLPIG